MLAFGVTLTSRLLLISAITEGDSLIVRNHIVTRRLARSDIEEFRIGRLANQPINETIHILLRDRRILTIEAAVRPRITRRGKLRLAQWQADLEMWLTHADGGNAGLTEVAVLATMTGRHETQGADVHNREPLGARRLIDDPSK